MSQAHLAAPATGELLMGRSGRCWSTGGFVGSGGEGVVYRTEASAEGQPCVVKIACTPQDDRTLEAEGALYVALAEQGLGDVVPRVFDYGTCASGRFFMVMEDVGSSIERWDDQAPLQAILRVYRQAAFALDRLQTATIHGHRLVHRDIKPPNLAVRFKDDGTPQVAFLDFGIARVRPVTPTQRPTNAETKGFAPLDQTLGRLTDLDPNLDRFGLGTSLYTSLTGAPPESVAMADTALTPRGARLRRLSSLPDAELPAALSDELEALASLPFHDLVETSRLSFLTLDDITHLREGLRRRAGASNRSADAVADCVIEALRGVLDPRPAHRDPDTSAFARSLGEAIELLTQPDATIPLTSPTHSAPHSRRALPIAFAASLLLLCMGLVLLAPGLVGDTQHSPPPPPPAGILPGEPLPATRSGLASRYMPAGTFRRGPADGDSDAQPDEIPGTVVLTRPLAVMAHELSQAELRDLLHREPWLGRQWVGGSDPGACATWRNVDLVGDNLPAICLDFPTALRAANAASILDGLRPAYVFATDGSYSWDRGANGWRMPTEAEWEVAASAGGSHPTWAGAVLGSSPCAVANLYDRTAHAALGTRTRAAPCSDGWTGLAPVGTLTPNAWGLHDLSGNAWEWVWDPYQPQVADGVDPVASGPSNRRVRRGGSFASRPSDSRTSARNAAEPDVRLNNLGVRFVRTLSLESK